MLQPKLTAQDRCDRCGAQAYTRWTRPRPVECGDPEPDAELLYCAHHTREHEAVLMLSGWTLDADDRAFLAASAQPEPEPA